VIESVGWELTGIALGLVAMTLVRPRLPLLTPIAAASQTA
jgi:hypothetical protein